MRPLLPSVNHPVVTIKDGWERKGSVAVPSRLSSGAETIIARAARLSRSEIELLDRSERFKADVRLVAWDVLRDRLEGGDVGAMRLSARNRAWAAVNQSLRAIDVDPLPGDDYWRVTTGLGWGAARAARFGACARVAPELVDAEIAEMLLGPWLALDSVDRHRRSGIL
jgi:hypothetical protein